MGGNYNYYIANLKYAQHICLQYVCTHISTLGLSPTCQSTVENVLYGFDGCPIHIHKFLRTHHLRPATGHFGLASQEKQGDKPKLI